jgi:mannose-6-phosphate isomerase-like protein (cupin superfamily)
MYKSRLIALFAALMFMAAGCAQSSKNATEAPLLPKKIPMSYHTNIVKDTEANENFRRVMFTGLNSQLVIMSIPPGGEVGAETHKYTEQTLFFLSGTGQGELNGEKFPIGPGDVVVVVPGTEHNFINTGEQPLKIYTVYAPPNHIDGRVQATKADADADTADEAVGEKPPVK